ncbi:PREDICTED: aspartyl protease APCB1 [Theobroma cacao]|uniref:Aspartyl protease APCB1 n=1 Tax=Theobroma cacao TaxID=3641 RepID=A0AB32VBN6_THECC|nr:PREDICTED: aspartyl protease APCB1 [Theobroma cacao]
MDSDERPQQVTGVVIITLPPSDNPSLGKTITAFTLTNDVFPQSHQTQQRQQQEEQTLPTTQILTPAPPSAQNPQRGFSFLALFSDNPRKLLGFLGISLFALLLYSSAFSNTFVELRNSNNDDDEKPQSFIFPLYHKLGADLELKLGRFVDVDKENLVASVEGGATGTQKINKLVASNAAVIDSSGTILPVRGNVYPDGLYFTYMLVGNPQRRYFLDIDTGSDLTWIQCDAPCSSCAKGANPLYKPTRVNIVASKDLMCTEVQKNQKPQNCETCQQCDYEIEYADRSSSLGVLARDELHLVTANGSTTNLDVVFGCAYDQQGILLNTLSKTDGILGLSRAKVSLPSQLASKGIINNVVGHCLATDVGASGYMFLGDDFVPNWGMSWVPMLGSPSTEFYHTQIVKINYGSSSLSLGRQHSSIGRVVFDSGSSYTYFMKQAYAELVASLSEVSEVGFIQDVADTTLPMCWQAPFPIRSIKDIKQFFKTLTLQFGSKWWIISKRFHIPPEGYLIISKKGNVCLGILDGSKVHDGSTIILGDISLRGQLVVYDNEKLKIGWTQSDCAHPRRFKSLPFVEG